MKSPEQQKRSYNVAVIVDKVKANQIGKPHYQRSNDAWSEDQQSKLIDSILRGYIDIPKFFAKSEPMGIGEKFIIIDGLQRINSLVKFKRGEITLPKNAAPFVYNNESQNLRGKTYEELEPEIRAKFNDYMLDFSFVSNLTEEQESEMFRLLQNGTPLKASEKRQAIVSKMSSFMNEIIDHETFFNSSFMTSKNQKRYQHLNMASVLMYLWFKGPAHVNDKNITKMYDEQKTVFHSDGVDATQFKKVLREMAIIFDSLSKKRLKKAMVLPLFLLVKKLVQDKFVLNDEVRAQIRSWYNNFLINKEKALDNSLLQEDEHDKKLFKNEEFQKKMRQFELMSINGTNAKPSIEERFEILWDDMLVTVNPVQKDTKRRFTDSQKFLIWIKNEGKCQVCGVSCEIDDFHPDHVVSHANGGLTNLPNARVTCPPCNLKKGSKNADQNDEDEREDEAQTALV